MLFHKMQIERVSTKILLISKIFAIINIYRKKFEFGPHFRRPLAANVLPTQNIRTNNGFGRKNGSTIKLVNQKRQNIGKTQDTRMRRREKTIE